MVKEICKFELKGKIIFSKPLKLDEKLNVVREQISKRVNCPYVFLDSNGNQIEEEDENGYNLEGIKVGEIIKLQEIGQESNSININNKPNINVVLDNKIICSINCDENEKLSDIRQLIKNSFKNDFLFLDPQNNYIEKEDEGEYGVKVFFINNSIKIKSDSILDDSSPTEPIREKENEEQKCPNRKKTIDFSKYEIIKKKKDLTIYKYSNVKRQCKNKLVYLYFFDKFEATDYDNAYIVLFCGRTGDGKSTAINAIFNIIKGIKLEDNYRFMLITEPNKPKGQAESQTDGVHLYYIKDYNNKPVIIIDSQGFGDTRGLIFDQKINLAFQYIFSSVINHINTVCFISKAITNRIDINTRYIFNSVTCLFSDDITENFIVVPTFATKDTIDDGPAFVESIKTEASFLKLQDRMDDKWWYALDSKCVLDNDNDKITKYSFEQMEKLYEEKIKKLPSKGIKKSAEVLRNRGELRIKINLLYDTFQKLMMEQGNLQIKINRLNEISEQIHVLEERIKNFENDSKNLNPSQLQKRLKELNDELNDKLNNLNSEVEEEFVSSCEYGGKDYYYNHCQNCKRNCHDVCDCSFKTFNRCTKFSWGIIGDKVCEECNCPKESHLIDHYHWIKKRISKKKDNSSRIEEERQRANMERQRYLDEINEKNLCKNKLDNQLNELNNNRQKLLKEKNKNLNEKNMIEKKISNTSNNITFIIMQLKTISDKIDILAMNNNNIKTEDEYIDSLKTKMDEIGFNDEEQKKELDKMKKQNKIFSEIKKKQNLNNEELADLLGVKKPNIRN
jgi:hypothetical protein